MNTQNYFFHPFPLNNWNNSEGNNIIVWFLFKKMLQKLLHKYDFSMNTYNKMIINQLINSKTRLFSQYKEKLILFDKNELLKKYYLIEESKSKFSMFSIWYSDLRRVFPNFNSLQNIHEIFNKNLNSKKRLIINADDLNKHSYRPKKRSNKIYNQMDNSIYFNEDLVLFINQQESNRKNTKNEDEIVLQKSNSDSIASIEHLIKYINNNENTDILKIHNKNIILNKYNSTKSINDHEIKPKKIISNLQNICISSQNKSNKTKKVNSIVSKTSGNKFVRTKVFLDKVYKSLKYIENKNPLKSISIRTKSKKVNTEKPNKLIKNKNELDGFPQLISRNKNLKKQSTIKTEKTKDTLCLYECSSISKEIFSPRSNSLFNKQKNKYMKIKPLLTKTNELLRHCNKFIRYNFSMKN